MAADMAAADTAAADTAAAASMAVGFTRQVDSTRLPRHSIALPLSACHGPSPSRDMRQVACIPAHFRPIAAWNRAAIPDSPVARVQVQPPWHENPASRDGREG